ncbi:MAG: ATP-dependent zinc metalloprotease FtsH [Candidatus Dormibacteria bacterium]
MSQRSYRRLVLAQLLLLPLLLLAYLGLIVATLPVSSGTELRLDHFEQLASQGKLQSATYYNLDQRVLGTSADGPYWVALPSDAITTSNVLNLLTTNHVPTQVDDQSAKQALQPLEVLVPTLLLVDIFLLIFVSQQRPALEVASHSRAGAGQIAGGSGSVTFGDVAGADESLEELREVRDFLMSPNRFLELGARVPRGILLEGPPGCGKTLLARAVAGEARVPFIWISGAQFVEMYVGVGAARIRDLFRDARAAAPSIVFIDEIDAVGRTRGPLAAGLPGGGERETTLNQLLVEMDGFDPRTAVVILAATNRPDILDPALLRPGRFDRHVPVDAPDARGRAEILRIHCRGKPVASGVDVERIARRTPGFTGADLANLVNEAALLAVRRSRSAITDADFEAAIDRVTVGIERRSRVLSEADKRVLAYHEAGHVVASHFLLPDSPVHKVSIVARARSLGQTMLLPEGDDQLASEKTLRDRLAAALSGRAAEELVLGQATAGAHQDIRSATRLAKQMVLQMGMSPQVGLRSLAVDPAELATGEVFRVYSEELAATADREIRRLLEEAHARAMAVLQEHGEALERVAQRLITEEVLDHEAVIAAIRPAITLTPA